MKLFLMKPERFYLSTESLGNHNFEDPNIHTGIVKWIHMNQVV